MIIPNLHRDSSGKTFLLQLALSNLGFYEGEIDNWHGRLTDKAFGAFQTSIDQGWHQVFASSFADLADVRSFKACKAQGNSDQFCFKTGDNGEGYWGHSTSQTHIPMVALPRDDWKEADKTGGAKVLLRFGPHEVEAILGDTMPWRRNLANKAEIDLNPAAANALGLTPPFIQPNVSWRWI